MVTEKYLVTVNDMRALLPMANELDEARIKPYILQAQSVDLRPVLGEALYYDFMLNFDNVSATYDKYRELINGKVYTYNGYPEQFEGLIQMVSCFALKRFIPFNDWHVTKTGNRKKRADNSDPMSPEEVQNMISTMSSLGISHVNRVKRFLTHNIATYTQYNQGQVENLSKNSAKFFDI